MEEALCRAAKSPGPHVPINSIRTDLRNNVTKKRVPQALIDNNELIRDYVAELRQRDQMVCSLFASSENDVWDEGQNLTPLCVPTFRPWQSPDCVQVILSGSSTPLDEVVIGASSTQNLVREEESSSVLKEQIGDKDDSGNYQDVEDNYPVNSQACSSTKGKEATTDSEDKTGGRNRFADKTETISNFRKRFNTTAECSYVVPEAETPSRFNVSETPSSGRDGLVYRRKRKVRSLADIMVEERNPVTEHFGPRPSSSIGIQSGSTETGKLLGPQKKRKAADEENQEPSGGMTHASIPRKGFTGLMRHEGKLFRSVESCSSEEKKNSYVPLNLRFGMNMQQMKNEMAKASGTSSKTSQIRLEKGKTPMQDLQCNLGNSRHASSRQEKTAPLKTSRSKNPRGRMPVMLKSRNAEVEATDKNFKPPGNSIFGDHKKVKKALDLSFNSSPDDEINPSNQPSFDLQTGIPDLNKPFFQKRGRQPTVYSLSPHNYSDISASCRKESIREGKRPLAAPEQRTLPKADNKIGRHVATKDILGIVHLLVKKLYERKIESLRNRFRPDRFNLPIQKSPAFYGNQRRDLFSTPFANRRNASTISDGETGFNLPQTKRSRLDSGKPELSQFRLFNSHIPWGKTQNAALSSIAAGRQNHIGDADLLWRTGSSLTPSFSDQCHKGRTVSDIKGLEENRDAENPAPYKYNPWLDGYKNLNSFDGSSSSTNNRSEDFAGFRYGANWRYKNTGLFQDQIPMEQGTSSGINLDFTNDHVFRPARFNSASQVCTLNRNPADFSTPDASNEFTISSNDLKFKRTHDTKGKSRYQNEVDPKTQSKPKEGSGRKNRRK